MLGIPLALLATAAAAIPATLWQPFQEESCQDGVFPEHWISGGPDCGREPELQVHAFNDDLYILRQSLCSHYEAPFLYLIFGGRQALLLDTGAEPDFDLQARVDRIVQDWKRRHGISDYELVVAHTHAHTDHTGGDAQFIGQPDTVFVPPGLAPSLRYFGFAHWPDEIVTYDLGERVLDLIPIPGHEISSIAFYDRRTCILLTGDSLYPGRLYVPFAASGGQWEVYKRSMRRLVDFCSTRRLQWILGCHIEMSQRPGHDFPFGTQWHPNEHELQLDLGHLQMLDETLTQARGQIQVYVQRDFIVYPFN